MDALIDLLLAYLGLGYFAKLLRTGSAEEAGQKLGDDLNALPGFACGCCLIYIAAMVVAGVLGLVLGTMDVGWDWMTVH